MRCAASVRPRPNRIATFEAELTDAKSRGRLLDFATRLWEGLDGLVSAAGVVRYEEALAMDEASLRAQLEVNLVAPALLVRDFAKHLRKSEAPGAVVLVGSTLATHPAPMTAAYAASKAGLAALARTFALELGPHGIRVNAVAPGLVDTEMIRVPRLREGEPEPSGEEREARIVAQLAELGGLSLLGRLGKPAEIAEAVRYLLDAPFVTGHVYVADGGLTVA